MSGNVDVTSPPAYADWKAPADDGEMLIWPNPSLLVEQTQANLVRLARIDFNLLGTALSQLRVEARAWVGHRQPGQPIIATGHQTELWHPGVWAKNAVIHAAAAAVGGRAYHFAVDTDSPKHLTLRWPGATLPITDDDRLATASWSGQLDAPSPAHIQSIRSRLHSAAADWGYDPEAFGLLESLQRLAMEQPRLSLALCNALHELDWELGLRYDAMVCSPIFESPAFLQYVSYILAHARRFAGDYNRSLRDYRSERGLVTQSRPMPDLFVSHEAIELPLWLDDLATGRRSRPSVFEMNGATILQLVSGEEIAFSPADDGADAAVRLGQFLAATAHRIAPRALTLTLFFRLFIADMFVHGIGGGRYDQVLDKLIYRHFGIVPPPFAVATATLLFPTAAGRERACVSCVASEGHQLRHATLGQDKTKFLAAIDAAPRASSERASLFAKMHTAIREHWPADHRLKDWEARLAEVRRQEQRDAVEFDRELFYGVQPRARLQKMIAAAARRLNPGSE